MDRNKIENALLDMEVPVGIKGFDYIADAVECIDEHGGDASITKELYPEIAEKRSTTPSRVERAIRHALSRARSCEEHKEAVGYYIGFINLGNYSSLKRLHMRLKREEMEGRHGLQDK